MIKNLRRYHQCDYRRLAEARLTRIGELEASQRLLAARLALAVAQLRQINSPDELLAADWAGPLVGLAAAPAPTPRRE